MQDDENGHVWVLNNKQGFQDCEAYAKLELWLGSKLNEYWDENFDRVDLVYPESLPLIIISHRSILILIL